MAQIIRATHLGFCFGVRDAITSAHEVSRPDQTSIYGELVHNRDVIDSLRRRDFQLLSETQRDEAPERPIVMITAHGISQQRRESLIEAGKELIDTTCPLVLRVHDAATKLAERGHFVVVIGQRNHVEVLGVIEDLPDGRWAVVSDPSEVTCLDEKQIGIVCQTTMTEEHAKQCRDQIASMNPDASIRWINTICRPTRQRQSAVDELCRQVDVVIVVGGANSNNTRRLVERCAAQNRDAHHVQSADDICESWLKGHNRIGITAGTSTPDDTIDAVEKRLRELVEPKPGSYATWTNQQWVTYFQNNLIADPHVPWSDSPTLSEQERIAIASSVQTFQLGESGEGKHLLGCADNWVHGGGDANYVDALTLFLKEENQHAAWLARFLSQENVPLLKKQWSDRCFRWLRHLAGLRTSIAVLVTAEILAQVYYLALMRATESPTLKAICVRILRDERAHVVFQQNQKRCLAASWSKFRQRIVSAAENTLFLVARRIVWHDHRSVFDAAAMDWNTYKNRTTRRWRAAQRPAAPQKSQ